MSFTRTNTPTGRSEYTFAADPRFKVVAETRQGIAGTHGDRPIFGRMSSDGNVQITGWHVEIEGSRKRFSPTKLLKDAKAKVLDPTWREWAISRAESS